MYAHTLKIQACLCKCAVLSESSLFAHSVYRLRRSLRQGPRDLVLCLAVYVHLSGQNKNHLRKPTVLSPITFPYVRKEMQWT